MVKISGPVKISLNEIRLKDTRFQVSDFDSWEKLALSIRTIGLLQPPLVTKRRKGFVLVSGWKRVQACRKIGLSSIPIYVLDEPDDLKAFLIAVFDNAAVREFRLLEKAQIISKLGRFGMEKSRILKEMMPLLQVPPTDFYLESYIKIAALEPEAKRVIKEKSLPFSVVCMLVEFRPKDLKAILPILLPLGQNKQKEILEDLREISKKKDVSARKILGASEILQILRAEKWPAIQKSERLRTALRKMRHPRLSAWQDHFNRSLEELCWPKEVKIEPSSFFEDEWLSVTFRFKNEREFKARLDKLQEMARKEGLKNLWDAEGRLKKNRA
jgi:hypothetical protein